jgi:hypothetical protein
MIPAGALGEARPPAARDGAATRLWRIALRVPLVPDRPRPLHVGGEAGAHPARVGELAVLSRTARTREPSVLARRPPPSVCP